MVPGGSKALDLACSQTDDKQLGTGSFSCNGICSMGFGLEHQIKSTSGVSVNEGQCGIT